MSDDKREKRVLRYDHLKNKGVCGSRMTLWRLRKNDATFPKPIEIGGGLGWFEDEVDTWLAARPRADLLERSNQNPSVDNSAREAA